MELVRYIHLNPLREKLVPDMKALNRYPHCGHAAIKGKILKSLRKTGVLQRGDERILGDGEFVESVLSQAGGAFEEKYRLKAEKV